jgi:hypothetical protein
VLAIFHCGERRSAPKYRRWWQFYKFCGIFLRICSQIENEKNLETIKSMEEVLSMKDHGTVSIYQCFTRFIGEYPVKFIHLYGLKYAFMFNSRGPLIRELVPETENFTEQIRLYEDFMYLMQDR